MVLEPAVAATGSLSNFFLQATVSELMGFVDFHAVRPRKESDWSGCARKGHSRVRRM